jgi:signal transduction histidine kinase
MLLCIVAAFWGAGGYQFSLALSKEEAFRGWQLAYIGCILTSPAYYHFVYGFLKLKKIFYKILLYLNYAFAAFFLYIVFFHRKIFLGDLKFVFGQFYWTDWLKFKSPLWLFFYISFNWILLSYSFLLLVRAYFYSTGILRNQLKYCIFGSLVAWVGAHGDYLLNFRSDIYPYCNFFIAIYPAIWAYAIVRYRLMDISIAITKTSIFVAVYSLILGLPLLVIYYLQNELVGWFGVSWWIVPFLCSTVLATLGPFLYIYFDKKAEEALLKAQRNYQNILKSASGGMIRIRNLDVLLKLIVYVITKIVRIKHAFIYLLNHDGSSYVLKALRGTNIKTETIDCDSPLLWQLIQDREPLVTEEIAMKLKDHPENNALEDLVKQLYALNASLVIPSFVEDRLIGILVLGEKRSRALYSQDDLAVFSVLANQAALAIENAQFYEEIRKTHESLFQAEKMATIGTMADGLSHQINNRFHALSLIAGDSLDVIKTYDCSQCSEETKQIFNDLKNSLERIQANVLQGGEVVKGLLKYSRPGQVGFERVSFKEVLDGAIEMVSYKIKLKDIDLVRDIPSNLPCLNVNIVQLQEVFFNLIDNAYDAIKERQMILNEEDYRGRIEISSMADQGFLHINVQDNGIGIKSDDKRKIFTPFFTTKATAKKGTGLGLYVIQKIIAAHSGQIRINSVYQSGTCFTVTLPVKPTLVAI